MVIVLDDDKFIITVTFRDEPIVIMTSEEATEVARLGSDINSLVPPITKGRLLPSFCNWWTRGENEARYAHEDALLMKRGFATLGRALLHIPLAEHFM